MFYAHSPDSKRGVPAQEYSAHVKGVVDRACESAEHVAEFALCDGTVLKKVVRLAAEYHDLGKLDEENQEVLSGKRKARKLPIIHTDAGTAYLLDAFKVAVGATLVRSHHIGLPDFLEEGNRKKESVLRDDTVRDKVNKHLPNLTKLHEQALQSEGDKDATGCDIKGDASLFFRLALSCLADGDHTDTAIHYGDQTSCESAIDLHPIERLAALDRYVEKLKGNTTRSHLRSEVYSSCRDAVVNTDIVFCDGPVGTGKTTSVMAHLLSQAGNRQLRRIIVVLPFTNIIKQSVKVYREALVLPGENPEHIVAELHHRAEFQDVLSRQFTALWKAPIIVTTAVVFFETLASNTPASLRKLHNLPGSAVFIDESHAALPVKLLPLAWRWVKGFAREWGCYWVMASGSLIKFWEIEEFDKEKTVLSEIISNELRTRLVNAEKNRVTFHYRKSSFGTSDFVNWVISLSGPRIVILNTVQSAAVIAREFANRFQPQSVEHLSTALTPSDRDETLERIKARLDDTNDSNWTLVATSCVEAGIDFSFKSGVREAASLTSLLQTAGRVNRHNQFNAESVWTITLKEENLLRRHPGLADSSRILLDLLSEGHVISPDLCTNALKREIRLAGTFSDSLLKFDEGLRFPEVEKGFRVIESDTRTVIIEKDVIDKLEKHMPVSWRDIQKSSVQIWRYRLDELHIPEVLGHPGMYKWNYEYDKFIGFMAGVLDLERINQQGGCVI